MNTQTSSVQTMNAVQSKVAEIMGYMKSAGPHPVEEYGWQMTFQFGAVSASVAWTPNTKGIEVFAWKNGAGLWPKAKDFLTGEEVRSILTELMETNR